MPTWAETRRTYMCMACGLATGDAYEMQHHTCEKEIGVADALAPLLDKARSEERLSIVHFLVDTSRRARSRKVVAGLRHAATLIDADATRARMNETSLLPRSVL